MRYKQNPIRKEKRQTLITSVRKPGEPYRTKIISRDSWVATCPYCKKEIRGPFSKNTRKGSKDALYKHTKKEHPYPITWIKV